VVGGRTATAGHHLIKPETSALAREPTAPVVRGCGGTPEPAEPSAVLIQRLVAQRFGGELRVGIGINTGVVIAGTIGGGSKLEFTLIGDPVNVAARVEQLTKTTGDAILLTHHCVDVLVTRPPGLTDRGSHGLKGKSAAIQVFGLDPGTVSSS